MNDNMKNISASIGNWKTISNLKTTLEARKLDDVLTILIKCYQKYGDKIEKRK